MLAAAPSVLTDSHEVKRINYSDLEGGPHVSYDCRFHVVRLKGIIAVLVAMVQL